MRLQLISAVLCALAAGVCSLVTGNHRDPLPFTSKDLVGEWKTDCAPFSDTGIPANGSLSRYYVNDRSGGQVRISFFGDGECQVPTYSLLIAFTIELGLPSTTQPNTREAFASIDRLLLNPSSEASLQLLSACGAEAVGQNYDITETGCAPIRLQSRAECPGEYELFRVEPGISIAPGFRTPNLCVPEGRPTRTQDDAAATLVAGA